VYLNSIGDSNVATAAKIDAKRQKRFSKNSFWRSKTTQDVATAAKIDAKHVKVTALRAGSVMVDMLIAKEVGDA
jgi:hypothetical protein